MSHPVRDVGSPVGSDADNNHQFDADIQRDMDNFLRDMNELDATLVQQNAGSAAPPAPPAPPANCAPSEGSLTQTSPSDNTSGLNAFDIGGEDQFNIDMALAEMSPGGNGGHRVPDIANLVVPRITPYVLPRVTPYVLPVHVNDSTPENLAQQEQGPPAQRNAYGTSAQHGHVPPTQQVADVALAQQDRDQTSLPGQHTAPVTVNPFEGRYEMHRDEVGYRFSIPDADPQYLEMRRSQPVPGPFLPVDLLPYEPPERLEQDDDLTYNRLCSDFFHAHAAYVTNLARRQTLLDYFDNMEQQFATENRRVPLWDIQAIRQLQYGAAASHEPASIAREWYAREIFPRSFPEQWPPTQPSPPSNRDEFMAAHGISQQAQSGLERAVAHVIPSRTQLQGSRIDQAPHYNARLPENINNHEIIAFFPNALRHPSVARRVALSMSAEQVSRALRRYRGVNFHAGIFYRQQVAAAEDFLREIPRSNLSSCGIVPNSSTTGEGQNEVDSLDIWKRLNQTVPQYPTDHTRHLKLVDEIEIPLMQLGNGVKNWPQGELSRAVRAARDHQASGYFASMAETFLSDLESNNLRAGNNIPQAREIAGRITAAESRFSEDEKRAVRERMQAQPLRPSASTVTSMPQQQPRPLVPTTSGSTAPTLPNTGVAAPALAQPRGPADMNTGATAPTRQRTNAAAPALRGPNRPNARFRSQTAASAARQVGGSTNPITRGNDLNRLRTTTIIPATRRRSGLADTNSRTTTPNQLRTSSLNPALSRPRHNAPVNSGTDVSARPGFRRAVALFQEEIGRSAAARQASAAQSRQNAANPRFRTFAGFPGPHFPTAQNPVYTGAYQIPAEQPTGLTYAGTQGPQQRNLAGAQDFQLQQGNPAGHPNYQQRNLAGYPSFRQGNLAGRQGFQQGDSYQGFQQGASYQGFQQGAGYQGFQQQQGAGHQDFWQGNFNHSGINYSGTSQNARFTGFDATNPAQGYPGLALQYGALASGPGRRPSTTGFDQRDPLTGFDFVANAMALGPEDARARPADGVPTSTAPPNVFEDQTATESRSNSEAEPGILAEHVLDEDGDRHSDDMPDLGSNNGSDDSMPDRASVHESDRDGEHETISDEADEGLTNRDGEHESISDRSDKENEAPR